MSSEEPIRSKPKEIDDETYERKTQTKISPIAWKGVFGKGFLACKRGVKRTECPYRGKRSTAKSAWLKGWDAAYYDKSGPAPPVKHIDPEREGYEGYGKRRDRASGTRK